ncbi:hypothetical protein CRE_21356 [Caenorhabditis remanei]|uniref:NTF2-like domain-containing protein n=1 Tax=Caenorhabditis remanei TaxID=31234 RepID=E3MUW9_CAERE|nr:hypothetical protein CRE_21356 [Caenorhabditis remanei]
MNFRTSRLIIVLFVLLQLIVCSENHKLSEILKKIGKRYNGNPALEEMLVDLKQLKAFKNRPDEEINDLKDNVAESFALHVLGQSSIKFRWIRSAFALASLMDEDMTAELCGTDIILNKYQFLHYLRRARISIERITDDTKYSYEVLPTEKDVLNTIITVDLTSKWGFPAPVIWNITAKYSTKESQNLYKIKKIVVGGGCMDHGRVNHKYTQSEVRRETLENFQRNNGHVAFWNLTDLLLQDQSRVREEATDKIPSLWLEGLDDNPGFLNITVCEYENVDPSIRTKNQFLSWYKRFGQMWHPKENDTDYIRIQPLNVQKAKSTFRITMRLQPGKRDNVTTFDFDFKVTIDVNQHGDLKVYITRLEVLCNPMIDYMDESLKAIREVVTENFLDSIRTITPPIPWYSSVEFISKFSNNKSIEVSICDVGEKTNLTQIEILLFHRGNVKSVELKLYRIDYDDIPLPALEQSYFRLYTISSSTKNETHYFVYEHEWVFHLQWDTMDQFYYIHKVELECPHVLYEQKDHVYLAFYQRIGG